MNKKFSIYKRKDGRFEGRYFFYEDNVRKYKSFYGNNYKDVEMKIVYCLRKETDSPYDMTVKTLYDEWVLYIRPNIKVSTLSNYMMKFYKHIMPSLGDVPCYEMSIDKVINFIDEKLKTGLSNQYVSDILILLKSIFGYAEKFYNMYNIIEGIRLPKKQNFVTKIPGPQEICIFEKLADENNGRISLAIKIALHTGLRIGEICALKIEDIDLKKRVIKVNKTIQRIQHFESEKCSKTQLTILPPKSYASNRKIPIDDELLDFFKKIKFNKNCFVLSNKTKPIETRTIQRDFSKLLKSKKLPRIHFHALRHAFATNCILLGVDIKTLSEILGHSSVKFTLDYYVHSSFDLKMTSLKGFSYQKDLTYFPNET